MLPSNSRRIHQAHVSTTISQTLHHSHHQEQAQAQTQDFKMTCKYAHRTDTYQDPRKNDAHAQPRFEDPTRKHTCPEKVTQNTRLCPFYFLFPNAHAPKTLRQYRSKKNLTQTGPKQQVYNEPPEETCICIRNLTQKSEIHGVPLD